MSATELGMSKQPKRPKKPKLTHLDLTITGDILPEAALQLVSKIAMLALPADKKGGPPPDFLGLPIKVISSRVEMPGPWFNKPDSTDPANCTFPTSVKVDVTLK